MENFYEAIEDIKIKWFENDKWEVYKPQYNRVNKSFDCKTTCDATIQMNSSQVNFKQNNLVRLNYFDIKVTPNKHGEVSGIQFMLSLHDSLRCTWKTHLAPEKDMTIGDKVFRSPVMIFENQQLMTAFFPDVSSIQDQRIIPYIMDFSLEDHSVVYGVCDYKETGHVYYRLKPSLHLVNEPLYLRFYVAQWSKPIGMSDRDFRYVEQLLWEKMSDDSIVMDESRLSLDRMKDYVQHTYNWAFENWKSICWQEFTLNEKEVGGVVFIVKAQQKPGNGRENIWREQKSLWNQAWFCSLRSAYGYWLWGDYWEKSELKDKASKVLEFALSAPQRNGLFPSNYQAGEGGRWETGKWNLSSDRRPSGHEEYVHLLDSSWTCYWLLKWFRDIRKDPRILSYVENYVERLLSLQLPNGSFPAWVRPVDLKQSPYLLESPETSMHIWLLCMLNEIRPNEIYIKVARKSADFIIEEILAKGRWEDFETYWSCSRQWEGKKYGKVDRRSGLYNQCNLGIYWTTEALKELYRATGINDYLEKGKLALSELALYQQIWQPPFFDIPVLGGFGVMNSDDEWNDARQSLFALTYLDYYALTGERRYKFRGMQAMKASFYMMYCPENPQVKNLYEKVHPFLDDQDFGFNMENFNHAETSRTGGIGEFTIFDWGNGAAAASIAEIYLKYKQLLGVN